MVEPILCIRNRDEGINHNKKLAELTDRQRQVYDLIVQGKSNKQITDELFIELSTLKTHINHIYKKLDVASRHGLKKQAMGID